MIIIQSLSEIRNKITKIKSSNKNVSLIPTMGNIHEGHLSLIRKSYNYDSVRIVTIFVNPLQFDNSTDLNNYPNTLEDDISNLHKEKVDFLYIPNQNEILFGIDNSEQLPWGFNNLLCGKFRENHFNGVFAIVKKLFEVIKPTYVFFGEKDYQQTILIKYVIESYFRNIELIICPTIRNSNRLALSSRNSLITKISLSESSKIIHGLEKSCIDYYSATGLKDFKKFYLLNDLCKTQYIEIHDEKLLHQKHGVKKISDTIYGKRIFIAVYIDNIRLIDNRSLEEYDNV
tara:strand:- start:989 stop:1849 length:861 start_codon:yes stop_codon:yes gene_type:complete